MASHLSERMVCDLKRLAEKYLLKEVVVAGDIVSPAQYEWAHRVGELLLLQLNRVLRSGYVKDEPAVLEGVPHPVAVDLEADAAQPVLHQIAFGGERERR